MTNRVCTYFLKHHSDIKYASENIRDNYIMAAHAIKINCHAFFDISDRLMHARAFVLDLFLKRLVGSSMFLCIPKELQKDREIILATIKNNGGFLLSDISDEFYKDPEIILAAICLNMRPTKSSAT